MPEKLGNHSLALNNRPIAAQVCGRERFSCSWHLVYKWCTRESNEWVDSLCFLHSFYRSSSGTHESDWWLHV